MKKLITIMCVAGWAAGVCAQGLVNFINTPATLSSAPINGASSATTGPVGSWYYGLLIGSGYNFNSFFFTGLYATNLAAPGRFNGGINVQVPGWAPGATTNYFVAIWWSKLGHDFKPAWLAGDFGPLSPIGYFGFSSIATGTAGGAGSPATPAYNLFGGVTGIPTGFEASFFGIPEPSSIALGCLGAVALLILRVRRV